MTFPINTAIPAAGNNPSVDQPAMQTNFSNISGFLSVDHVAPGSTGAGQHNQVTFNINQTAPGLGSGVSGLYSNSASGVLGTLANLFFQNATKNLRLTNIALTTSGTNYGFVSPWGLIINFGLCTPNGSSTNVTYAVPYTTAVYSAQASPNSSNLHEASVKPLSGNLLTKLTVTSDSTTCYYFAIGV